MKRTIARAATIAAAACLTTGTLAACSISSTDGLSSGSTGSAGSSGSTKQTTSKPAPKPSGECSPNLENKENPIVEDVDLGPVSISVLYFQPGQMMEGSKMLDYDKSAAHLEVDTKMTEKGADWGYANGETPADMRIKYTIKDQFGTVVDTGMLMEMNAGDGSHYGTNIATGKMKDGKYTIQFVVDAPKLGTYPLHKDKVTGVKADGWYAPITTDWFEWNYLTPKKLDNPVEDCDVPAFQPVVTKINPSENPDKNPAGKCDEPEINIGSADAAPFTFDVNYFQPGGMMEQWLTGDSTMPLYQDSIAHLEADIKMTDELSKNVIGDKGTDYGYSVDETPAGLNIKYSIIDKKTNAVVNTGMFMEMNAGDGSHYGTNLKKNIGLVDNTDYILKMEVAPPKNYSLHIDRQTGVKVRHWFKPFTVEMPWHYTGNQKACIVKPWEDAFPPRP